jgi:hypothetical protein
MDAAVHRIEALPGIGRYAVTFRRGDGSEQSAVVQLRDDQEQSVEVAEASLPPGWRAADAPFTATVAAVRALDAARRLTPERALRDVAGGWDVSLGNVVLGAEGAPECTAHGTMAADPAGEYRCAECGARALLG